MYSYVNIWYSVSFYRFLPDQMDDIALQTIQPIVFQSVKKMDSKKSMLW
jgi:hypothetical protein